MDRKIEKKKWSKARLMYMGGAFLFIVLAFYGFKSINRKVYKVHGAKISTKKVTRGEFQNVILFFFPDYLKCLMHASTHVIKRSIVRY